MILPQAGSVGTPVIPAGSVAMLSSTGEGSSNRAFNNVLAMAVAANSCSGQCQSSLILNGSANYPAEPSPETPSQNETRPWQTNAGPASSAASLLMSELGLPQPSQITAGLSTALSPTGTSGNAADREAASFNSTKNGSVQTSSNPKAIVLNASTQAAATTPLVFGTWSIPPTVNAASTQEQCGPNLPSKSAPFIANLMQSTAVQALDAAAIGRAETGGANTHAVFTLDIQTRQASAEAAGASPQNPGVQNLGVQNLGVQNLAATSAASTSGVDTENLALQGSDAAAGNKSMPATGTGTDNPGLSRETTPLGAAGVTANNVSDASSPADTNFGASPRDSKGDSDSPPDKSASGELFNWDPSMLPVAEAGQVQSSGLRTATEYVEHDQPAPTHSSGTISDIRVQLNGDANQHVSLRLVQQGDGLRVIVRSNDPVLTQTLQERVPELTTRLDQHQYQTEVVLPDSSNGQHFASADGRPNAHDNGLARHSGSSSQQNSQGKQNQQQKRQVWEQLNFSTLLATRR